LAHATRPPTRERPSRAQRFAFALLPSLEPRLCEEHLVDSIGNNWFAVGQRLDHVAFAGADWNALQGCWSESVQAIE